MISSDIGNKATPDNLLGLPKKEFGLSGIKTGNFIFNKIKYFGYNSEFNSIKNRIIIVDSSDIKPSVIFQKLYFPYGKNWNMPEKLRLTIHRYEDWLPSVMEERDENGNILIELIENKLKQ